MSMKATIIGGGISGLSCAWRLRELGLDVVLLEADERTGGKIKSERTSDGYLVEWGPNGFLNNRTHLVNLAKSLGIGDQMITARDEAKKRYVMRNGQLEAVPGQPGEMFSTGVMSMKGRLRLLKEPFVPKRSARDDESVYDFALRRLGPEAAELMDAVVTGIYAGDARQLSMQSAFPKVARMEQEHGGLARAALAGGVAKLRARSLGISTERTIPKLAGFRDGMETLTRTLTEKLGDAVQTGREVTRITKVGRWRVDATGGDPIECDVVVVATPTRAMADLLAPMVEAAVEPLQAIPYAPAAVVALGFPESAVPRSLDAFGFLVPSSEGRRILGGLFTSSLFVQRAPSGHVMIRAIMGGARDPEVMQLDDEALVALVQSELGMALGGAMPEPAFQRVVRWASAIPQYTLGHQLRVARVKSAIKELRHFYLAGNGLFGVSMADCAERADQVATLVRRHL